MLPVSVSHGPWEKFLNIKLQTQIGPVCKQETPSVSLLQKPYLLQRVQVMSLNPILSDWYDPVKEGTALYKTLLLDPKDRVEIAKIVQER